MSNLLGPAFVRLLVLQTTLQAWVWRILSFSLSLSSVHILFSSQTDIMLKDDGQPLYCCLHCLVIFLCLYNQNDSVHCSTVQCTFVGTATEIKFMQDWHNWSQYVERRKKQTPHYDLSRGLQIEFDALRRPTSLHQVKKKRCRGEGECGVNILSVNIKNHFSVLESATTFYAFMFY